jgi:hypothetical protein
MLQKIGGLFGQKKPQAPAPAYVPPTISSPLSRRSHDAEKKHSYSKIFRWHAPDHPEEPQTVEVVGSFTQWRPVPLERDPKQGTWHATVHHIPGNKTHHYMLLVNGKPTYDKTCDGLVMPSGFDEQQFQLDTAKGPRVLMLFAQTK